MFRGMQVGDWLDNPMKGRRGLFYKALYLLLI